MSRPVHVIHSSWRSSYEMPVPTLCGIQLNARLIELRNVAWKIGSHMNDPFWTRIEVTGKEAEPTCEACVLLAALNPKDVFHG